MPNQLNIEYPQNLPDIFQTTKKDFEKEARMAMAVKLFEMKRISSGKPIYCVMKGEVADLVIKNEIGFSAQPGDINDIRSGFEKFLDTSEHEFQVFGRNMKVLLSNEYDRDKIIQQMTDEIFFRKIRT